MYKRIITIQCLIRQKFAHLNFCPIFWSSHGTCSELSCSCVQGHWFCASLEFKCLPKWSERVLSTSVECVCASIECVNVGITPKPAYVKGTQKHMSIKIIINTTYSKWEGYISRKYLMVFFCETNYSGQLLDSKLCGTGDHVLHSSSFEREDGRRGRG